MHFEMFGHNKKWPQTKIPNVTKMIKHRILQILLKLLGKLTKLSRFCVIQKTLWLWTRNLQGESPIFSPKSMQPQVTVQITRMYYVKFCMNMQFMRYVLSTYTFIHTQIVCLRIQGLDFDLNCSLRIFRAMLHLYIWSTLHGLLYKTNLDP